MSREGLSELQLRILRLVSGGVKLEKLAEEAGAPATAVGMEIARLQLGGYITDGGTLTDKGSRAARQSV